MDEEDRQGGRPVGGLGQQPGRRSYCHWVSGDQDLGLSEVAECISARDLDNNNQGAVKHNSPSNQEMWTALTTIQIHIRLDKKKNISVSEKYNVGFMKI